MKVADGGFINKFFNPVYEKSNKLDTWLRYEATDWTDVREAENMIDRDWQITDISSQSLAVILTSNPDMVRIKRQKNEKFLYENIKAGRPLVNYKDNECPLLHNRLMSTKAERDSLRQFLFTKKIFTSIHWPTHEAVLKSKTDIKDTLWLEDHIISIPVSQDYNLNDMEYIADSVSAWKSKNKKTK
jgi:dTDP-4-amino-4,6-dideoxygalactose transaminase